MQIQMCARSHFRYSFLCRKRFVLHSICVVNMSCLQSVWQCFDPDEKEKTVAAIPIILHKEHIGPKGRYKGVTFNGKYRAYGRWIYIFDENNGTGWMFIEFAAGSGNPRRHVFSQCDDDVFELIPADAENTLYNNEEFWSQWSELHTNKGRVLLHKATIPGMEPATIGYGA